MKTIILASASPRRKELLEQIGISFQIQPAMGEEKITCMEPVRVVEELSYQKAMEITAKCSGRNTIVIGADTIVSFNNKIMGKPVDASDAIQMLQNLSDRTHQVYTGVTAILIDGQEKKIKKFSEVTEVTFYPMTLREIEEYVSTGEPMDKAGAYGIQGIGGKFVRSIHGDYNNVVGLPVARLYQDVLKDWLN